MTKFKVWLKLNKGKHDVSKFLLWHLSSWCTNWLVQACSGGWSWHFGNFKTSRHSSDWCLARKLVVVVTPWWQEMVEGRRKWSVVACQVAEIRGNPVVARPKI